MWKTSPKVKTVVVDAVLSTVRFVFNSFRIHVVVGCDKQLRATTCFHSAFSSSRSHSPCKGMQLGFATSLRLASIRVSAPPHFIFSCDEYLA